MDIPRVTSDWEARQEEHVLDGLGEIGVAQIQHRIVAVVPTPTLLKEDGPLLTCWIDSTSMMIYCNVLLKERCICCFILAFVL